MGTGKGSRWEGSEWRDSVINMRAMSPDTLPSSSQGQGPRAQLSGSAVLAPQQIFHRLPPPPPPPPPVPGYLKPRLPLSLPRLPCLPLHCHYITASRFTPSCRLFHKEILMELFFSRGAANCCQNSDSATHIHIINHTGNQGGVA